MERQAPAVLKLLAHDLRWTLLQQLVHSDYRVAELVEQMGTGPGVQRRESSCPCRPSIGDPHACPKGLPDEPVDTQTHRSVWGSVI
jgi:hypothetical protein